MGNSGCCILGSFFKARCLSVGALSGCLWVVVGAVGLWSQPRRRPVSYSALGPVPFAHGPDRSFPPNAHRPSYPLDVGGREARALVCANAFRYEVRTSQSALLPTWRGMVPRSASDACVVAPGYAAGTCVLVGPPGTMLSQGRCSAPVASHQSLIGVFVGRSPGKNKDAASGSWRNSARHFTGLQRCVFHLVGCVACAFCADWRTRHRWAEPPIALPDSRLAFRPLSRR